MLPSVESLWRRAWELGILPKQGETRDRLFESLKSSKDLQKDWYIRVLETELELIHGREFFERFRSNEV